MPAPDLIIFDCDGVLVDSEIVAARAEAQLLVSAGVEITPEELTQQYAGLTFKDILLEIEEKTGTPLQASLLDRAETVVDQKLKAEVRVIEGAHRAAAAVGARGCVCSNSSEARIRAMFDRIELTPLFEGRIFSAFGKPGIKPKPAPDVFLHAAEAMRADPAHTFVIEDSVHGVTGARAAGMRVIGFTGASHSYPGHADSLTEAGAETVIHRLADLGGVVEALSVWSEDGGQAAQGLS